jgi:translation initiation factor IF-2
VHTASDTICIGIVGVDVTDGCYIGHVFEEPLDPDNLTMAIDVNGKVGTLASSRRFKDHIKPMDKTSEAILALKPVTFHYKSDKNCSPRFGLIAEEVAEVDPNLVARDKDGKPYSVRYDQVNAMLLNEFLKEHRRVQELEKGMAVLTAQLKEQAAQIQKASAQMEMNKVTTTVVLNNP